MRALSPPDVSDVFCVPVFTCMYTSYSSQDREWVCRVGREEFLSCSFATGHWPAPSLSTGVRGERGHIARRWPPKVMVSREECESLLCCRSGLAQLLSLCYPSLATLPSCPSSVGISWGSCPVHSTSSFLGPLLTQRGS